MKSLTYKLRHFLNKHGAFNNKTQVFDQMFYTEKGVGLNAWQTVHAKDSVKKHEEDRGE